MIGRLEGERPRNIIALILANMFQEVVVVAIVVFVVAAVAVMNPSWGLELVLKTIVGFIVRPGADELRVLGGVIEGRRKGFDEALEGGVGGGSWRDGINPWLYILHLLLRGGSSL